MGTYQQLQAACAALVQADEATVAAETKVARIDGEIVKAVTELNALDRLLQWMGDYRTQRQQVESARAYISAVQCELSAVQKLHVEIEEAEAEQHTVAQSQSQYTACPLCGATIS